MIYAYGLAFGEADSRHTFISFGNLFLSGVEADTQS